MAFVITQPCIGSKDASCVDVCPVDCIHPTPDERLYARVEHLYINPNECIDCRARPPVLPTPFITSRQFRANGGRISGQTLIFTDEGESGDVPVLPADGEQAHGVQ
jgi:NAD-dependent dihydropyrimidine dehydrogenase PreA subunit